MMCKMQTESQNLLNHGIQTEFAHLCEFLRYFGRQGGALSNVKPRFCILILQNDNFYKVRSHVLHVKIVFRS